MSKGGLSPQIDTYINNYFKAIRKKSIIKDPVYIAQLEKNAKALCAGDNDMNNCHFILKNITFNLHDGHSFFSTPQEWKEMYQGDKNLELKDATFASEKMIGNIAYVYVPTFASVDNKIVKKNVKNIQDIIAKLDAEDPKGWIIDLSDNEGGNSFAMFPGLGPLLGNGICSYSISDEGNKIALVYNEGKAGWDKNLSVFSTTPYHVKNDKLPIAVLYGNNTGSSGAVTALTFRGKANSKSFGQHTANNTTRVDNIIMSDGASLNLASGYDMDRNKNVYTNGIDPEVITENHEESIKEAIKWLIDGGNK